MLSMLSTHRKAIRKNCCLILCILLLTSVVTSLEAITAQEVMENALAVYENIDNYGADVETYQADSMEASPSLFEAQQPIVAFNLFFRKPAEHAVQKIRPFRHGIFRVELLSALGQLRDKVLNIEGRETLHGQNCYVLACTSPEESGTTIKLWISPKDWTVQQFTLIVESLILVNTQFKYPPGGSRRVRFLPMETRSFFPLSKKVLINRLTNYRVNTGIPSDIFKNEEE